MFEHGPLPQRLRISVCLWLCVYIQFGSVGLSASHFGSVSVPMPVCEDGRDFFSVSVSRYVCVGMFGGLAWMSEG